jgi:hypothetical protein
MSFWKRQPVRSCWSLAAVATGRSPECCSVPSVGTAFNMPCPVLVVPQSFASVEGHDSDVMHRVGHHVEPLRGHVSA